MKTLKMKNFIDPNAQKTTTAKQKTFISLKTFLS